MKKVISLIIALSMILGTSVFAEESHSSDVVTTTVSEYTELKELTTMSTSKLTEIGYTKDEISEVKNLLKTLKDEFQRIRKTDFNELKKEGYSDKQIKTIKALSVDEINNFDSISVMPMAAFSTMNFTLKQDIYQNRFFSVEWEWYSKPFFLRNDGVALAWDSGFRASTSSTVGTINYVGGSQSGTYDIHNSTFDIEIFPGAGIGVEFPMVIGNPNIGPTWAKSGNYQVYLSNPNHKSSIQIVAKYGHSTYNLGSVGISVTGVPSIGFSSNVDESVRLDKIYSVQY